jgi:hypothetical protein
MVSFVEGFGVCGYFSSNWVRLIHAEVLMIKILLAFLFVSNVGFSETDIRNGDPLYYWEYPSVGLVVNNPSGKKCVGTAIDSKYILPVPRLDDRSIFVL